METGEASLMFPIRSAYLRLDHFHSAFFTGDPVFHPFIFAADAFVIVNRTENFSAEQPSLSGLMSYN